MAYYTLFYKKKNGEGVSRVFKSVKGVAEFTGKPYWTIVGHFTRKKKSYVELEDGVTIIKSISMERTKKQTVVEFHSRDNIVKS